MQILWVFGRSQVFYRHFDNFWIRVMILLQQYCPGALSSILSLLYGINSITLSESICNSNLAHARLLASLSGVQRSQTFLGFGNSASVGTIMQRSRDICRIVFIPIIFFMFLIQIYIWMIYIFGVLGRYSKNRPYPHLCIYISK